MPNSCLVVTIIKNWRHGQARRLPTGQVGNGHQAVRYKSASHTFHLTSGLEFIPPSSGTTILCRTPVHSVCLDIKFCILFFHDL